MQLPDVLRRGLRLSIGLAICNSVGFALASKFGGETRSHQHRLTLSERVDAITDVELRVGMLACMADTRLAVSGKMYLTFSCTLSRSMPCVNQPNYMLPVSDVDAPVRWRIARMLMLIRAAGVPQGWRRSWATTSCRAPNGRPSRVSWSAPPSLVRTSRGPRSTCALCSCREPPLHALPCV